MEFHPEVLRDVADVDTTATVFGETSRPCRSASRPTGFTRLMQTEGETAGAGAAAAAGIPFTLSTLGTTSIEHVKEANPGGAQLVPALRDAPAGDLLRPRRARRGQAGFETLFFTVDTPDRRRPSARQAQRVLHPAPADRPDASIDALPRPWWWIDFLTTPKLEFASLSATGGTVGDLLDMAMDPTISFEDLQIIRDMWPGKLAVKGVQSLDDAKRFADLGIDGIVLSNHGGRQLDRAPIPFHLLPEVVREVGNDTDVLVDTGIMNGADIVAAVALGAKFTLIGRAYLYGLMAGGRAGVDRTIEILSDQIVRTMKLLGAHSLEELTPAHVTQLERLAPRARS